MAEGVTANNPSEDDMAGHDNDSKPTIVEGITSGQKARNYLKDIDGVTLSMLRTNADVKKVAKEHNIQFPDWEE